MLASIFKLKEHQSTVKTEIIAGLTTFVTMAYILAVNPNVLSSGTGMDKGAVFVATCLAAAISCFIMGIYANLPIALAPGMGLNAFFTYTVVQQNGHSWQVALGCVFISGILFILLSLFKIRELIINSIPSPLKKSIAAGIGGFLAIVVLKNSGVIVSNPDTLVSLGNLTSYVPAMTFFCFFLVISLQSLKIPGGVLIAMFFMTLIAFVLGRAQLTGNVVSLPPSILPTFMQMDILGALKFSMISVIFAFFFVDLFDTTGTIIGVTGKAGLRDEKDNIPNLKRALLADSSATVIGATLGTSNTTAYIESTAGVAVGGRTGLTAVVVGIMFLVALFFWPLMAVIPSEATSGAILYVAVLMMYALGDIKWDDISEAAPAVIVILGMPFSYSIADGITLGFISYTVIKLLTGKHKEVTLAVWFVSLILLFRLLLINGVFDKLFQS